MTLDDLLLSCRADTALARLGCRTVDDVCQLTRSQIAAERNCARGSIAEIEAALRRAGRTLAEEVGARATKRRRAQEGACVQGAEQGKRSATLQPWQAETSLPPEGGQDGA